MLHSRYDSTKRFIMTALSQKITFKSLKIFKNGVRVDLGVCIKSKIYHDIH